MGNRKPDLDHTYCAGCQTPLSFLRGEPVKVNGQLYHPNCKPSQDPRGDQEYWQGIREGYRYHQDKAQFGADYAEQAEIARELRAEGYAAELPQPPRKARPVSTTLPEDPNPYRYPKWAGYDLRTPEGCRAKYKVIRFYALATYDGARRPDGSLIRTPAEFDDVIRAELARKGITEPTPQDWVKAALGYRWKCPRCAGTGAFITGTVNGKPTGPGGSCFRCNGQGAQQPEDAKRNFWHDMHYAGPAI